MAPITDADKSWEDYVADAHSTLVDKLVYTPVIRSKSIADILADSIREKGVTVPSIELFLKCENQQKTGSFKLRGATHLISKLSESQLRHGLVTFSTGNHALAVACAAETESQQRGILIPCTVIMPTTSSAYKIAAAEQYGANVILHGHTTSDGAILARKLQRGTGATLIPPSGHEQIMLGQATVMREFAAQIEQMYHEPLDLVLVPSAGGALLAGTGIVCENSKTLVIGAEPERGGADLRIARQTGLRTGDIDHDFTTVAEGLRSPTADFNWKFLCNDRYVHDVFGATEDQIKIALKIMMQELKMVVEPSAAVALAVLLFNKGCLSLLAERKQWRIGLIVSGGNVSVDALMNLIRDK